VGVRVAGLLEQRLGHSADRQAEPVQRPFDAATRIVRATWR
jgi:hypothetical protein